MSHGKLPRSPELPLPPPVPTAAPPLLEPPLLEPPLPLPVPPLLAPPVLEPPSPPPVPPLPPLSAASVPPLEDLPPVLGPPCSPTTVAPPQAEQGRPRTATTSKNERFIRVLPESSDCDGSRRCF